MALTIIAAWHNVCVMRLDELFEERKDEWNASRLARDVRRYLPRSVRTTPSTIGRLLRAGTRKQRRTASVELALAIEQATGGLVHADEVPLSAGAKRVLRTIRAQANGSAPTEPAGAAA